MNPLSQRRVGGLMHNLEAAAACLTPPVLLFINNFLTWLLCKESETWPSRPGLARVMGMKVQGVVIAWWPSATSAFEPHVYLAIYSLQAPCEDTHCSDLSSLENSTIKETLEHKNAFYTWMHTSHRSLPVGLDCVTEDWEAFMWRRREMDSSESERVKW